MKMSNARWLIVLFAIIILSVGIGFLVTYLNEPRTAAEALTAARKVDAKESAAVTAKKSLGTLDPQTHAGHLEAIYEAYGRVEARFPKAPEVEEADWRVLQLQDENSTGAENRIALAGKFLDKHTSTTREADLRWKIAELTHRELKRLLAAVDLYEKFATKFRDDQRAAEALFRVGQIYEEIKEFARAVEAYQRVAKEFPKSAVADQAQFRAGSLLAEQLEKREEAMAAFEQVERNAPAGSRMGRQAGEARQRLATQGEKDEQQKARSRYYRGVQEVPALDRFLSELDSPPFQMLRSQQMDLVFTSATVAVSPKDRTLTATATLSVIGKASTSTLAFMIGSPIEVTAVRADLGAGEIKPRFERRDDFVFLDFGKAETPVGTTFTVTADYGGVCEDSWGLANISTSSTMLVGYHFLPTLNLGDKRPLDITITAPSDYVVIATGEQQKSPAQSDTAENRLHFIMDIPVYWTGLAIAKYKVSTTDYVSTVTGRTMPLTIYLQPDMPAETAQTYLNKLPYILSYYESLLGAFPYKRLGIAQVGMLPGGLGTPGLLMLGPPAFAKPDVPAEFLAHEVSHAWFGNVIGLDLTVNSPVWLSEGFAEYLDAMYHAHENGSGALARTMRDRAMQFFTMTARIKERPLADLRGNIVAMAPSTYTKGAYVLHMLRGVMGDVAFGNMMRQIVEQHRDTLFNLPSLQRIAEQAAGQDLDWFFQQWVRETGLPRIELVDACRVSSTESGKNTNVAITIVQKGPRAFRLPLDVVVDLTDGTSWSTRLDVTETTSVAELAPPGPAKTVRLDPQTWILKHPRSEEWQREISDECTTAGLSGVEAKGIPTPSRLGEGLSALVAGRDEPQKLAPSPEDKTVKSAAKTTNTKVSEQTTTRTARTETARPRRR